MMVLRNNKIESSDKLNNSNTTDNKAILIVDTAADQSTCGGPAWTIINDTGTTLQCSGYMKDDNNSEGQNLPVVSAITCVEVDNEQPFLFLMHQACYYDHKDQNESLCHPYQSMEHGVKFCLTPKDTLTPDGNLGKQNMIVDEKEIPLEFDGRKMYLNIRKPTQDEIDTLDILEITSPEPFEPEADPDYGNSSRRNTKKKYKEYPGGLTLQEWRKRLALAPEDVVRKTFEATTQLSMSVEAENRVIPRDHYKSRFPFLRERRLNDEFHSDTFFPSVNTNKNETCSQLFFGQNSDYMFVQPMKTESHSHVALQDFGRQVGIPKCLKTDNAQTEVGKKWTDWCRTYMVKTKFTEPKHPWQNLSEQGIGDLARMVKRCMRAFDAPLSRHGWCQLWCCKVRNCLASRKLNWRTPTEKLTGDTPDISIFRFHFWEAIEYYDTNEKNPHDGWKPGRFLGINESAGDAMTYFIEVKSKKGKPVVITRSNVRSKKDRREQNLLPTNSPSGERNNNDLDLDSSRTDDEAKLSAESNEPHADESNTNDETPQIFEEDVHITFHDDLDEDDDNETFDDNILVDQQIDHTLEADEEDYEFNRIKSHYWDNGILTFTVELTSGTTYSIPFTLLKTDRPIEVAKYIKHNVVENKRGGKYEQWSKKILTRAQRIIRRMNRHYNIGRIMRLKLCKEMKIRRTSKNQRTLKDKNRTKFGIVIPNNVKHALLLDKQNNNQAWAEAILKEMNALTKAGVWDFKPPNFRIPKNYQFAPLTLIFDVKQEDLRRKARLVAGGHVVDSTMYESYSSVVQTRTIRILETIAMNEELKFVTGDISNAFVQADTDEKIYSIAGPEFGEKEGSIVIVKKALYGLATSARRWSLTLGDAIKDMGFKPTRADPDLWIKSTSNNEKYEYIATYVDDIIIVAEEPSKYLDIIKKKFPIRNIEELPEYYLGNNLEIRKNKTIKVHSKKYVTEIIKRYEKQYGSLKKHNVPSIPNDHPELDDSPLLDEKERRHYQSNIGICQWICTAGRFDIAFAVSSLSRFSHSPREGHLERSEKILGYLKKYPKRGYIIDPRDPILATTYETIIPDFGNQYQDFVEEEDDRLPEPRMKELSTNIFVDSNHGHDRVTGRSITGLISFVGRTPVYWASKRQSMVQTPTFGAEFMALKKAVEEAVTLRYYLRSMGVMVTKPTVIYGDNLSSITNATTPGSPLKEKYLALSYHFCREHFSAGIVDIRKIGTKDNYADAMTKALVSGEFNGFINELMEN